MVVKNKIYIQYYEAPCGRLSLGSYGDSLCLCDWHVEGHRRHIDNRLKRSLDAEFVEADTGVLRRAVSELDEYFAGTRKGFDIDLLFVGTDFQKLVWQSLLSIPYGRTISYGEMARLIGRPSSVRAVANANGANAISIFTPCHRVIGSDGTLTGYGGGIDTKRFLLSLEGVNCLR